MFDDFAARGLLRQGRCALRLSVSRRLPVRGRRTRRRPLPRGLRLHVWRARRPRPRRLLACRAWVDRHRRAWRRCPITPTRGSHHRRSRRRQRAPATSLRINASRRPRIHGRRWRASTLPHRRSRHRPLGRRGCHQLTSGLARHHRTRARHRRRPPRLINLNTRGQPLDSQTKCNTCLGCCHGTTIYAPHHRRAV